MTDAVRDVLVATLGPGGVLGVFLIAWYAYRQAQVRRDKVAEGTTTTMAELEKADTVAKAEELGLIGEWQTYAREMVEQNRLLRQQIDELKNQNHELHEQNAQERRRQQVVTFQRLLDLAYVQELRSHINQSKGPPPPPWPDGLTPVDMDPAI